MPAIQRSKSDALMINAPTKHLGLRRVLTPLFNNFKPPRKLSSQELFTKRWQQRLREQPLAKLIEHAQGNLTVNGTLLYNNALEKLQQQITAGKRFFNKKRYGFIIIVGENQTPYAIYDTVRNIGGSTGKIKLVQNLSNKQFTLLKTATDCQEKALEESQILDQLGLLESRQFLTNQKGVCKSYLILKILPGLTLGNFKTLCKNNEEALTSQQQAEMMLSMLEEMQRLIGHNIHHGDISDENVLIDPLSMKIQLIDFGEATKITKTGLHHQQYDLRKCYSLLEPMINVDELKAIASRFLNQWSDIELNLQKAIEAVSACATQKQLAEKGCRL